MSSEPARTPTIVAIGARIPGPLAARLDAAIRPAAFSTARAEFQIVPTLGPRSPHAVLLREAAVELRAWRLPRVVERHYLYVIPATDPDDARRRICWPDQPDVPALPWGRAIRPLCVRWAVSVAELRQTLEVSL